MTAELSLLVAGIYVLLGRWVVSSQARWRSVAFAALNVAAAYLFYFYGKDQRFTLLFSLLFVAYVAMVSVQYLALVLWSGRSGIWPWLAFLTPIGFLVALRFAPTVTIARLFSASIAEVLRRHPEFTPVWVFVGISYLAFRTSHLALLVRDGAVKRPDYWQYLGFAFFVPTLAVGPINPYSQHSLAFGAGRPEIPAGRALLRVLVGAVKYRFLGPLLNQLTYAGLLLDGHPHHWVDLPIAAVAYYLYLYVNFSGFCDIAVGAAGLMGIPVAENFDRPFAARNVKDFWNRWHLTLSVYMRDVVFSPLSMALVRAMPGRANHAIALTIFVVFFLVGVWHGVGWNYVVFGVLHGLAVVANHYYAIFLKARLGKERFRAYSRSKLVHALAVVLTFVYVTCTVFLFANDLPAMRTIWVMLRAH